MLKMRLSEVFEGFKNLQMHLSDRRARFGIRIG